MHTKLSNQESILYGDQERTERIALESDQLLADSEDIMVKIMTRLFRRRSNQLSATSEAVKHLTLSQGVQRSEAFITFQEERDLM